MYCVSSKNSWKKQESYVDPDKFISFIQPLHQLLNFKEVRLTGGEPTLYPGLIELVYKLKQFIPTVSLTTNAYILESQILELRDAGLDSVNVSLDSLQKETFQTMSRGSKLEKTVKSIEKLHSNKIRFKINTTVIRGQNDGEVLDLLDYSASMKSPIRFIEFMKMGEVASKFSEWFVPESEILSRIQEKYNILPEITSKSSTAKYWRTENGSRFGIIANESSPFCSGCDRLRLDHKGSLFGCLSSPIGLPIISSLGNPEELKDVLRKAMILKQKDKFTGSSIIMKQIGG